MKDADVSLDPDGYEVRENGPAEELAAGAPSASLDSRLETRRLDHANNKPVAILIVNSLQ